MFGYPSLDRKVGTGEEQYMKGLDWTGLDWTGLGVRIDR